MPVRDEAVHRQLDRIVDSSMFRNAERLRGFLRFVVTETLAGRQKNIKEYLIGREVCGRPASFDPKSDPIVRVDANRLRTRLAAYYQADGLNDEIRIELPKGAYLPVFSRIGAGKSAANPRPPSVAVLPFANLGQTSKHDYVADSLTEDLIGALARLNGLHVIARSSVFEFKDQSKSGREVGKFLRVSHVLEGSVLILTRRRIRITAQLIDVEHGWLLWSEKYESEWKNVLGVQDEIIGSITDAMQIRLTSKSASALFIHATHDADAYTDYLRGRYYWNQRTRKSLSESVHSYERSLERDPGCAPAYSGLADTWTVMALNDQEATMTVLPKARAAARKALELRPRSAEAHTSSGFVKCIFDWDWEGGAQAFEAAIRFQPGYSTAYYLYGIVNLAPRGLWTEAVAALHHALRLDPVSPVLLRDLGLVHFMRRDWDKAEDAWNQAEEVSPRFAGCSYWRARLAIEKGQFDRALEALNTRLAAGPVNTRVWATMAYAWARRGDHRRAHAILRNLTAQALDGRVPPLDFATIWLGLEKWQEALNWLDKACAERAAALYQFGIDPIYNPIRAHPQAQALRLAMGLPQMTLK